MNEKIIPFQKFEEAKKKRDEKIEFQKRMEQKEEEMISAKVLLEDTPVINILSIESFLGEKYIHYDLIEKEDGFRFDFPEISVADLENLAGILKDKNIGFKIESNGKK